MANQTSSSLNCFTLAGTGKGIGFALAGFGMTEIVSLERTLPAYFPIFATCISICDGCRSSLTNTDIHPLSLTIITGVAGFYLSLPLYYFAGRQASIIYGSVMGAVTMTCIHGIYGSTTQKPQDKAAILGSIATVALGTWKGMINYLEKYPNIPEGVTWWNIDLLILTMGPAILGFSLVQIGGKLGEQMFIQAHKLSVLCRSRFT